MESQLINYKKKFYILLEKYKNNYILANSEETNDSRNFLNNTESNIHKLFNDLFLFKSSLLEETNNIESSLEKDNETIQKYKSQISILRKKLNNIENNYNASKPMKEFTMYSFQRKYVDYLLLLIIFILLVIAFIKL
jgi:hypothetical protein